MIQHIANEGVAANAAILGALFVLAAIVWVRRNKKK